MKLHTLAAACAAVVAFSATAAMAGETIVAKLQSPVAERTKFIAGGAIFNCEADACVALAPTSQTFASGTCKTIAAKVGPVSSFGGRKQFEADRLGDCNVAAARTGSAPQLAKQ